MNIYVDARWAMVPRLAISHRYAVYRLLLLYHHRHLLLLLLLLRLLHLHHGAPAAHQPLQNHVLELARALELVLESPTTSPCSRSYPTDWEPLWMPPTLTEISPGSDLYIHVHLADPERVFLSCHQPAQSPRSRQLGRTSIRKSPPLRH